MAGWRQKKREMLSRVHCHFEVPAVYLTHAAGVPIQVTVRLHRKSLSQPFGGDFSEGAGFESGILSSQDRIIFQKCQLPDVPEGVLNNAFVIFGSDEAYITGPSRPERDGYLWVDVSEMPKVELAALIPQLDLYNPAWVGVLV